MYHLPNNYIIFILHYSIVISKVFRCFMVFNIYIFPKNYFSAVAIILVTVTITLNIANYPFRVIDTSEKLEYTNFAKTAKASI